MVNHPSQPTDDDEISEALTPLPSHQDYRRSIQRPPRVPFFAESIRLWILMALITIGIILGIGMGVWDFSASGGTAPARPSAASTCEQAWLDNKDNMYNALRTKAEYMQNCVTTQKALDQLREDHR